MGRKSKYTPELGDKIIELLTGGMSALAISRLDGMPTEGTIRNWAVNPDYSDQDFTTKYARARELGADHEFDRLEDIEQELRDHTGDREYNSQVARVLIDSIKWRLSKKMPAAYGERSHLEVSGGLKTKTLKDQAPEWLRERLAGGVVEVIEHDAAAVEEPTEDEIEIPEAALQH